MNYVKCFSIKSHSLDCVADFCYAEVFDLSRANEFCFTLFVRILFSYTTVTQAFKKF